jgi:2-methylisocitrate lyase-like PEP mutase family enzyme
MSNGPRSLAEKARELRQLHTDLALLPNAWDAASARAFADLGFPALATTSSGMSASLGYADRQQTPVDEMFAAVARITRSVDAPVTADLEAGYELAPDELVERLLRSGAVGLNLEDTDHRAGGKTLFDAEAHAARLAAVKNAAKARGADVFLNARVDVHLRQIGAEGEERLAEALRRARIYLAAGADSIYPIFVNDQPTVAAFVELGAPVNVLFLPDGPSIATLHSWGVRRVSFGGGLQELSVTTAADRLAEWTAPLEGITRQLVLPDRD